MAEHGSQQEANVWRQRKTLASLHQELETIALFDRVHEMTTHHDSADDRAYAARQIRRWQIAVEIQKLSGNPEAGNRLFTKMNRNLVSSE